MRQSQPLRKHPADDRCRHDGGGIGKEQRGGLPVDYGKRRHLGSFPKTGVRAVGGGRKSEIIFWLNEIRGRIVILALCELDVSPEIIQYWTVRSCRGKAVLGYES